MEYLDQKLISYSKTDIYPFHMPGHKRQNLGFFNPCAIDITEISGFDNLHHAEEILKEAQERAAKLYGSERCYYLVNGSTCGLLAAICAATKKGDKVLVARNSHKAVYHALFLNELKAEYLYPVITGNDLQGQITSIQIEEALRNNPDTAAVIVTSPTYEGIMSDIAGIAKVCHARGVPLIVDEAHGAHLGFEARMKNSADSGEKALENAVQLGADAVIMSLHKTLPSLTQTALLHINGTRIDREEVERYLGIFQTSSPSYLFMAGMDACIREISQNAKRRFSDYRRRLNDFYRNTEDLKYLHVMKTEDLHADEAYAWDDSKLVIFVGMNAVALGWSGARLHRIFLEEYHLEMEMVSAFYVLGMTSIMDTDEGFWRLAKALHEIDAAIAKESECHRNEAEKIKLQQGFSARMYTKNNREMQMFEAMSLPYRKVPFSEAAGKISADYVYLYPPGIPLIVPGEVITREFLEKLRECRRAGLSVEGQRNLAFERIKIVYF